MSDKKSIKDQTTVKSGNVTPETANKDAEELKKEELDKVTGGVLSTGGPKPSTPYGDWLG